MRTMMRVWRSTNGEVCGFAACSWSLVKLHDFFFLSLSLSWERAVGFPDLHGLGASLFSASPWVEKLKWVRACKVPAYLHIDAEFRKQRHDSEWIGEK